MCIRRQGTGLLAQKHFLWVVAGTHQRLTQQHLLRHPTSPPWKTNRRKLALYLRPAGGKKSLAEVEEKVQELATTQTREEAVVVAEQMQPKTFLGDGKGKGCAGEADPLRQAVP